MAPSCWGLPIAHHDLDAVRRLQSGCGLHIHHRLQQRRVVRHVEGRRSRAIADREAERNVEAGVQAAAPHAQEVQARRKREASIACLRYADRVPWPCRIEVSKSLRPGSNTLEVDVTNLWVNRLIGDQEQPDDCQWTESFLTRWPNWLTEGKPRPQPSRITFTTWKHWAASDPLLPSGLIGPVTLRATPRGRAGAAVWLTRRIGGRESRARGCRERSVEEICNRTTQSRLTTLYPPPAHPSQRLGRRGLRVPTSTGDGKNLGSKPLPSAATS